MSYCPKCGNKVEEAMVFCPRCGASLRGVPPPAGEYRRRGEKSEKNEKDQEKREKDERDRGEKQEKGEHGFIGFLIGGLILITIGLFSLLRISGVLPADSGASWALMLLLIGVIIIVAAIYLALSARRRNPATR